MRTVIRSLRNLFLALSTLLCLVSATVYILRPDALAGLTFWPPWLWAFPGVWLAVISSSRRKPRAVMAVLLLWIIYLAAFAEEPRSIASRRCWPAAGWEVARKNGYALRVVSLNCGVGNRDAAAEVAAYRPDIVLLQEVPTERVVRSLARQMYGARAGVAMGLDTAIIANGAISPSSSRDLHYFTEARLRLANGTQVAVYSVHLRPPVFRTDPWRVGYWRDYSQKRAEQRVEMRRVAARVAGEPTGIPVIAGGDFNAPAGDAIFRLLRPRLVDSFAIGGIGWGNTAVNEAPVSRIDQVWISRNLRAAAVVARRTRHSDHRLVICDVYLP